MKKSILLLIVNCALFIAHCSAQWIPLNSGTNIELNVVFFADANTGYVLGGQFWSDFTMLKTTDAGNHWVTLFHDSINDYFSVFFTNPKNGFLVGWNSNMKDLVIHTTDGGNNWDTIFNGTSHTLNHIFFIDSINGYMIGYDSIIFKTSDGGKNWIPHNTHGEGGGFGPFLFTDINNGYGIRGTSIFNTSDGGITWSVQTINLNINLSSISFPDKNTGYISSYGKDGCSVYKTTDAGNTWIPHYINANLELYSIFFTDVNRGYAVGNYGNIIFTQDGGSSWSGDCSGTDNFLWDVTFVKSGHSYDGYAVGDSGTILEIGGEVGVNQLGTRNEELGIKISPNPVKHSSVLSYQLSEKSKVMIKVYDIMGNEVETLINETQEKGEFKINFNAEYLSSGVYFMKLTSENGVRVEKLIKN